MRYHLLALAGICLAFVSPVVLAEEPTTKTTQTASPRNGCSKLFTRKQFHQKARQVYRSTTAVTQSERKAVRRHVRCQRTGRSKRIVRKHLSRYKRSHGIRVQWAYYKANPMPYCTWANESGEPSRYPEWAPSYRYRVPNSSGSAASGKYQIMDGTWAGYGGTSRGFHSAAKSPPLEQEKIGRRIYHAEGTSPWSGCH